MDKEVTIRALCAVSIIYLLTPPVMTSSNSGMYSGITHKCEPLDKRFCSEVRPFYNNTIFPNLLGNTRQVHAYKDFEVFIPLIKTNCSKHLKLFLCFLHAPPCTIIERPIPVCRSMCRLAMTKECMDILNKYDLRPKIFECSQYPNADLCMESNSTISTTHNVTFPDISDVTYPDRDVSWYEDSYESTEGEGAQVGIFLLVSNRNRLELLDIRYQNSMDTITLYRHHSDTMEMPIDYYLQEKYIYWASNMDGKLLRGRHVMEDIEEARNIVDVGSSTVDTLAVDWNLQVLFWLETYPVARLMSSSLTGRQVTAVIDTNLAHPISLTLDPTEGKLFWISRAGDLYTRYATIECYSVVTDKRSMVLNITSNTIDGGGRPAALIADLELQRLFWLDARSMSLHSVKYDGSDHKILLDNHDRIHDPGAIAIFENHVIWTDKRTSTLNWVNKNTGKDEMVIKRFDTNPPQYIKIYGHLRQKYEPNYEKSRLSKKWRDLSSSENMADKETYDDDDDYNDDDDGYSGDRAKNKKRKDNKSTGVSTNCVRYMVIVFSFLVITVFH